MKILALMPDPYRGFGGIGQYNRDLLDSLTSLDRVERIVSYTRHNPPAESPFSPPAKLKQRFLPGSELRYVCSAAAGALRLRPDIVLVGHINLLPVGALIKKLTGCRLVVEVYGFEAWKRLRRIGSWATREVDLVISISRFTREKLISWSGLDSSRIKVVPNAVHLDQYSCGEKPQYLVERYGLRDKLVLLTVGRLPGHERYKGQDKIIALLRTLSRDFPNLVYLIVGDGSDRRRLESLVESLGVQGQVRFAGQVPESEKVDHYNLADAFAMPSTSEGFGFVFLEAAACGLPVLGGALDGSRDALVDGRLGVMVDPDSPEELLGGLRQILRTPKQVPACLRPFDYPRFRQQVSELFA